MVACPSRVMCAGQMLDREEPHTVWNEQWAIQDL